MEKGITQTAKHTLMLDGRSRAKLTGVTAVSCFNDREVVLETGEGEVALLGENLHIEQLNLDDGQLDVTGEIAGVEYETPRKRSGADFLDEKT
ncbi:MAG: YabP/YqfC family sporulation protein [Christensenellales bacterium]